MSVDLEKTYVNKNVFIISGGFLTLFAIASIINLEFVQSLVNISMKFACHIFGPLWQVMLLLYFLIALFLMFSSYGDVRLGGLDKPEFSFFKWVSIILCTVLAGGGVFWSAAEPITHFLKLPSAFVGYESGTPAAIAPAMAQSFLHWGFLAWTVVGTLATIVLMYACFSKGMPFQPRALLYPVLGEKGVMGPWGTAVDATAIIAVAAGTIGPIGFLALQLSFALDFLFEIPNTFGTQLAVVVVVTLVYTITAATPIYKGINILSQLNVYLALFVLAFMMIVGPGSFIVDSFFSGFGLYVKDFFYISLFRGDPEWLGWWTIFYWGWFLGFGPMMAILTARISRGRTIRELVFAVAIVAPIVTNFWFSVLGGGSIYFELTNPGSIAGPLAEHSYPAALLCSIAQLPWTTVMIPLTLLLVSLFLVTTGAGITYSIAVSTTGKTSPPKWAVLFWGLIIGAVSAVLIRIGEGGVSALQTSMIVTAIPVTIYFLPVLWTGPRCAALLKKEQSGEKMDAKHVKIEYSSESPVARESYHES